MPAVPKQVDHEQRRGLIADALLEVAAAQGLEAVSLRHVAAQAGVTSGMVQHYFPSKDAMVAFAMRSASARYGARMAAVVERLGPAPEPRALATGLLTALLPLDLDEERDARVALAFQSYAATRPSAADGLRADNEQLCSFLASLLAQQGAVGSRHELAATALLATAEGLGVLVVSSGLPAERAVAALNSQVELTFAALAD
jgi:AcrR family transcriptional regulator